MKKLIAFLLLSLLAYAQDNPMAGTWRTTNGFQVTIPNQKGSFSLVYTRGKERIAHPAHWVKDGQEFVWTDKQGAEHRTVFEPTHKPARIRDVGSASPQSPAFWYPVQGGK